MALALFQNLFSSFDSSIKRISGNKPPLAAQSSPIQLPSQNLKNVVFYVLCLFIYVMPIFNSFNKSAVQIKRQKSVVATRAEADRCLSRVKRTKSFEWTTHATFAQIDASRKGAISNTISEMSLRCPNRKLNILDWGCGDGTAAKELANNSKLNVFGFSIDASEKWLDPKGVTFLQTTVKVLPRFLKMKKIQLDIVFAEASLKHMLVNYQVEHFERLFDVLNVGGKIFSDPVFLEPCHIKSLEQAGFHVERKGSLLFSLTRKK